MYAEKARQMIQKKVAMRKSSRKLGRKEMKLESKEKQCSGKQTKLKTLH